MRSEECEEVSSTVRHNMGNKTVFTIIMFYHNIISTLFCQLFKTNYSINLASITHNVSIVNNSLPARIRACGAAYLRYATRAGKLWRSEAWERAKRPT